MHALQVGIYIYIYVLKPMIDPRSPLLLPMEGDAPRSWSEDGRAGKRAGSVAPFLAEEVAVVDTWTLDNGDRSEAGACTADEFQWISQRSRRQVRTAWSWRRMAALGRPKGWEREFWTRAWLPASLTARRYSRG